MFFSSVSVPVLQDEIKRGDADKPNAVKAADFTKSRLLEDFSGSVFSELGEDFNSFIFLV